MNWVAQTLTPPEPGERAGTHRGEGLVQFVDVVGGVRPVGLSDQGATLPSGVVAERRRERPVVLVGQGVDTVGGGRAPTVAVGEYSLILMSVMLPYLRWISDISSGPRRSRSDSRRRSPGRSPSRTSECPRAEDHLDHVRDRTAGVRRVIAVVPGASVNQRRIAQRDFNADGLEVARQPAVCLVGRKVRIFDAAKLAAQDRKCRPPRARSSCSQRLPGEERIRCIRTGNDVGPDRRPSARCRWSRTPRPQSTRRSDALSTPCSRRGP